MPTDDFDRALGASYRLEELVGRGAAGEVWRGVDRRTGQIIAAKLLRREHVEDADLVDRFLRERSILTGLRHPSIVAVRDLVVEGDRLAIVMEYVDGGSLRSSLRGSGPLNPALALKVTATVLAGLAAAHEQRVLHRDVKPDNVLLNLRWRELGEGAVKLSDFGVSRILADRGPTSTGLVGTPEYMAPEQLLTGVGDFPADVYASGVLAYELLAGRTPFAGPGTGYTIAHRHVTTVPPRLPLPDQIWDVLAGLLAKDPDRRPTAAEAAAQLRALKADDLTALPAQDDPDSFESAGGPVTEVRGLAPPPIGAEPTSAEPASTEATSTGPASARDEDGNADRGPDPPLPDLGSPGQATMLRSMPTVPERASATSVETPGTSRGRRWRWRDPRVIALVLVGAVLTAGGIYWMTRGAPDTGEPTAQPVPIRAQQQSETRPTGLGVSRDVSYDEQTRTAQLSITYSAQRAPLTGPFLEVLPGTGGDAGCPATEWQGAAAKLNAPSATGIDTACGWSVQPSPVPARSSTTVTASVPLVLPGPDPAASLQTWLDGIADATRTATTDSQVSGTSYPAQRLTDVEVRAPARTVSGKTLKISLVPVWPSGADELNPLFTSPPTGRASSLLTAAAGGASEVRFSDGCSGALSVSKDGLVVTASSVANNCQVQARVGNFTDLTSSPITIATRGS